jgi:hypothetical protein
MTFNRTILLGKLEQAILIKNWAIKEEKKILKIYNKRYKKEGDKKIAF